MTRKEDQRRKMVNILRHLLIRPDYLTDKEFRWQIEQVLKAVQP